MPKLTLSAKKSVINKAKALAETRGVSVSAMFSQYVTSLANPAKTSSHASGPITSRLRGLAKVSSRKSDRELYEAAVLAKKRS